ncbi:MAG: TonB-dependent receptor [Bacteroidales bacterium]|nr:TonB-dependent receptor [Bacteroidales bacterium]
MPILCFKRWSRKGYAVFASLHKVVKIGVVTFSCTLTQASYHTVFAQVDSLKLPADEIPLDEVEVSASQPLPWTATAFAVSSLKPSDIAAAPVLSLDALLDHVPGVDIRQRGPDGVQADISLNGGTFDQVLILLNGVNITDPQTGHHNLNLPIELWQLQRVDILRGSAASLLGAHAFSGAINLVTTGPPLSRGWKTTVQTGLGSWQRRNLGAMLSRHTDKGGMQVGISQKSSAGYQPNTDYDQLNGHIQADYRHETAGQWLLQLGYQQKSFGANQFYSLAYPNQFEATKTLFAALSWQKAWRNHHGEAQVYERRHHDRFELFRDNKGAASWYSGHNYHRTRVTGGRFTLTHRRDAHLTAMRVDLRNEHILSNVLGEPMDVPKQDWLDADAVYTRAKNRLTSSLFANQRWQVDQTTLSAGLAINTTSGMGWYWNGHVETIHRFSPNFNFSLSVNRAVRLPTFTDLYYQSATQVANPMLSPEKAVTGALKLDYQYERLSASFQTWHRRGSNQIDWVRHPDSIKWYSRNLTRINASGALMEIAWSPSTGPLTRVSADYAFQHLDKDAEGLDSKYALDYLRHKAQCKATAQLLSTSSGGNLRLHLIGAYYDRAGTYADQSSGALLAYAPYWMWDSRLTWTLQAISLNLDVNNLFDTTHTDFGGLRQPGRHVSISLKLTVPD